MMNLPITPKRSKRRAKDNAPITFATKYEKPGTNSVHPIHGGYGVLVPEGYIVGPYFNFDNAERKAFDFTGAVVVRWVDFIQESTIEKGFFRDYVAGLDEPLTIMVIGYKHPVSVMPPEEAA